MKKVLKASNLGKQYRLGEIGTGTLSHDLVRLWNNLLSKEDSFTKIGEENIRSKAGGDYVWALKDVNFEINQGEVVGILGKNGAGKSTLLKLLSEITNPTVGEIGINGKIASLLEVGTGFHPELTGRENIYLNAAILGMRKQEVTKKLDEIVEFSGCAKYLDTPVKRYSSGMVVRLGFAVAAHLEPDILIVDEVLAVGDSEFQEKCIGKMKDVSNQGRTVLFVSHNLASLKALCKRGILLENGLLAYDGTINGAIQKYLSSHIKTDNNGTIPDNASSINTGVLRFSKFLLADDKGDARNSIHYLSPMHLYFELESTEEIADCLLDVRICSLDGIELVHAMNKYSKDEKSSIRRGLNKIQCKLSNQLQPGKYSFTIGVHLTNGATLDYVENILDFNILNVTSDQNTGFLYDFKLAHVRFESEWLIEN